MTSIIMTFSTMTFSTMTLGITILSIIAHGVMTFSISLQRMSSLSTKPLEYRYSA